jgi:hypothetical protein
VEDVCYALASEKYNKTFEKNKNVPPLDLELVRGIMTNHWNNARKGKPHGNPSTGKAHEKINFDDTLRKVCQSEGLFFDPEWATRLHQSGNRISVPLLIKCSSSLFFFLFSLAEVDIPVQKSKLLALSKANEARLKENKNNKRYVGTLKLAAVSGSRTQYLAVGCCSALSCTVTNSNS